MLQERLHIRIAFFLFIFSVFASPVYATGYKDDQSWEPDESTWQPTPTENDNEKYWRQYAKDKDAAAWECPPVKRTWRAVFTVGGGLAATTNLGESQTFPIQNPVTDEFYRYSPNNSWQTSFLAEGFVGVERILTSDWAIQAGFDYNQITSFSVRGTLVQGADAQSADTFNYHYDILSKQALFAVKMLYSFQDRFHPYLFAGLGVTFNDINQFSTNVPPFLTFTRMYSGNSSTESSYAVGVGVDVDINQHTRVGIGYRFTDLGQIQLNHATINGLSVNGTLSQNHLYVNELLAQFTLMI